MRAVPAERDRLGNLSRKSLRDAWAQRSRRGPSAPTGRQARAVVVSPAEG